MLTEEGQRGTKRDKRGTNPNFLSWLVARLYKQEGQEGQRGYKTDRNEWITHSINPDAD